jgi:hypothetical protein
MLLLLYTLQQQQLSSANPQLQREVRLMLGPALKRHAQWCVKD